MLTRNTILLDRYRIVRPLGKGGMGLVYEAIDHKWDSIVALKQTFADTPKLQNAFEREAKLLANLKHRVLPKVTDHFATDQGQFLVMEFIEGLNLAENLKQSLKLSGRPFRYEAVLPWANELLDALTYLHSRPEPIVHRDIKPANIKVTNEGEVYLLDFGLAKGSFGQETTSVHGGTVAYAPIEQLNNSGTSAQSDIYSLGATLYHLLTGEISVVASERYAVMDDERPDPFEAPHQSHPEVPESISAVISRAMAMKRKDRFESAAAMKQAFRQAALLIDAERERRLQETPTLPMENLKVPGPTVPAQDAVHQWAGQDPMIKGQPVQETLTTPPPVVPPPPSWPSHIDSEPLPAQPHAQAVAEEPDVELQQRQELERQREAEEAARHAAAEAKKRADEEAARRAEVERRRKEEAERVKREAEEKEARRVAGEAARLQAAAEAARHAEEEHRRQQEAERLKRQAEAEEARRLREEAQHQSAAEAWQAASETKGRAEEDASLQVALPIQGKLQIGSRMRVAMIAAGVLVIAIIAVVLAAWRPWSRLAKSSLSNSQTSTTNTSSGSPDSVPAGMVHIAGGEFTMGSNFGDEMERPPHHVTVKPFYIDIYEVTNQDYEQFVKGTGHHAPSHWSNGAYPRGDGRKPVTNVSWDDANKYCHWAKKELPTEEQWEFAARGTESRVYPWGSDWRQNQANANGASTTVQDVGAYKGVSGFGLYDMVGNAWEWTRSDFRPYPGGPQPKNTTPGELKVIRGGSFESKPDVATTTFRYGYPARGASYEQTGFRCAMDADR